METNVTALIAVAAGFLSFVSPCVLPLVPSYMVFITGLSFDLLEAEDRHVRWVALKHSLAFVSGFAIVFILLGASATYLGALVQRHQNLLMRLGGLVVVFFGLYLAGWIKLGGLSQERRFHLARKPHGLFGTAVVGMTFGLGWTPCIGPILGSILVLASNTGDVLEGMFLLAAYALGLGVPFLVAGIAFPQFVARLRGMNRQMHRISKISGVLLVTIGVLMVAGQFGRFTAFLSSWLPTIELEHLLQK